MATFELLFLGTAASAPSVERGLPAILVSTPGGRVLVDCGEGTQRQLMRSGAGFRRLDRVLLTHRHLDHVLGLGGLTSTLALFGAAERLSIHGGPETIRFVRRYLLDAVWPGRPPPIPVEFAELEGGGAGTVAALDGCTISCFPVSHAGTDSLGYLFETPGHVPLRADRLAALGVPDGPVRGQLARGEAATLPDGRRIEPADVLSDPLPGTRLAIVGDAGEVESLVEPVGGADALVIEATYLEQDAATARERDHLTAGQAAWLAREAGVGALYLTHISGRYDVADILAEARRVFPETKVVADLDRVRVGRRSTAVVTAAARR
jgi:ribonuclease Z